MNRHWVIGVGSAVAVVALLTAGFLALNPGTARLLDYYEVVDANTIIGGTVTGDASWTRVTGVVESSSEVKITVRSFTWPVTTASIGRQIELTVSLEAPLGDRRVTDEFHTGASATLTFRD